jgi:hypothetical protein
MMTPKTVFRNVLQSKNRERPPFVPFVCGLAARTANINVRQMVIDPGFYSNALEGFHALLGVNVLTVNFDASMESEALGAEIQWPGDYDGAVVKTVDKSAAKGPDDFISQTRTATVVETVKRLSITAGQEKAVACVLLGPCAFIYELKNHFVENGSLDIETLVKQYGPYLTKLVRNICEQKIDAFFFREDILGEQFMPFLLNNRSAFAGLYTTLFNIVKAFNAFPLIITDHLAVKSIPDLHETLKPSGVVLFGHTTDPAVLSTFLEITKDLKISIGWPLPTNVASPEGLLSAVDTLDAFITKNLLRNIFYCSDGEISHDIELAILLELMDRINANDG